MSSWSGFACHVDGDYLYWWNEGVALLQSNSWRCCNDCWHSFDPGDALETAAVAWAINPSHDKFLGRMEWQILVYLSLLPTWWVMKMGWMAQWNWINVGLAVEGLAVLSGLLVDIFLDRMECLWTKTDDDVVDMNYLRMICFQGWTWEGHGI